MAASFLYVHPASGDFILFDGHTATIEAVTLARWNSHLKMVEIKIVIRLPSATMNSKDNAVHSLEEISRTNKDVHLKDCMSENVFPLKLKNLDVSRRSIYRIGLSCLFDPSNYEMVYKNKNDDKPLSLALPSIKAGGSLATGKIKNERPIKSDFIKID